MPIGTVLDDGLADLVAPLEIHRTWGEPTASGTSTSSTWPNGSANFEPFPGSWADDHIRSNRGGCLLCLLVGQGLCLSLGLSLSLSLSLGLCLLLLLLLLQLLHGVDNGSILTSDQLICYELLLESLLGLGRRLLDLLLNELRSLKWKAGALLLRLQV